MPYRMLTQPFRWVGTVRTARTRCLLQGIPGVRLFTGRTEKLQYSKVFKEKGQKKTYTANYPVEALPADESVLSAEIRRLESSGDCEQLLCLLQIYCRSSGLPIRKEHCNGLLNACLKARDAVTADKFIMGSGAHTSNPDVLRLALQVFSAAGASEKARAVLNILTQLGETITENDYNLLLHATAKLGDSENMLSIGERMKQNGIRLRRDYYNLVLKSHVQSRNHEKAIRLFEEMTSSGEKPDKYTWASLIQSYIVSGNLPGAEKLLHKIIKEEPTTLCARHFNLLMKAHGDARNQEAAYNWFETLTSCSATTRQNRIDARDPPLGPDIYSFGICLSIASAANDKKRVLGLIAALYRAGLELNHTTWRVATAPFGKSLDYEGFREVIDLLIALNVKTTFVVWRDLIGILSRCGLATESHRILREMEDDHGVKPNQSCYIRVVRAYCKSLISAVPAEPSILEQFRGCRQTYIYNWPAGRDVIREMRTKGVKPTANIWGYVILSCAESSSASASESEVESLLDLISEMYECDGILPRLTDWSRIIRMLNFDDKSILELFSEDDNYKKEFFLKRNFHKSDRKSMNSVEREEILFFKLLRRLPPHSLERFLEDAVRVLCDDKHGADKAFYILSNLTPYATSHAPAWHVLLDAYSLVGHSLKCQTVLKSFEAITSMEAPITMWLRLVDSFAFGENQFDHAFEIADDLILRYQSKFGSYNSIDPDKASLVPFFNRLLDIAVMADDPSRFSYYFELITEFRLVPNLDTLKILAIQYVRSRKIALFNDCVDEMIRIILSGHCDPPGTKEFPVAETENNEYVEKIGRLSSDYTNSSHNSQVLTTTPVESLIDTEYLLQVERFRRTKLVESYFQPLLDALIENGFWGLAENIILKLRTELIVGCDRLCSRYMAKLASDGKIEDAVAYAEACITDLNISLLRDMSVWHDLLQGARDHQKPLEAQFAIEKMLFTLSIVPDAHCWNLLIHTYGEAGQLDAAAQSIKDMQRYCDHPPPASCWNVLFEVYKRQRKPEGCLSLLHSMYKISNRATPQTDKTGFSSFGRKFCDYISGLDFNDSRSTEFADEIPSTASSVVIEPTPAHWHLTVQSFTQCRGGKAAYKNLCEMRESYKVVPLVETYVCVVEALIREDEPEIIGEILRCMNEDNLVLRGPIIEDLQLMRRFDIVLEVMDEIGGLNGTKSLSRKNN